MKLIKGKNVKLVLNLHWGFIPGGVAKYAAYIEDVSQYAPLKIKTICINSSKWPLDKLAMALIQPDLIQIAGRCDPSWIWRVRKCIKKEKPDLIFTFGFNGCFVAAISSLGLKIPIISSWHGNYHPSTLVQKIRSPFIELLIRFLFRYIVKEIVTVSNYSKELLFQKSIPPNKINCIYNGIPPLLNNNSQIKNNTSQAKKIRQQIKIPSNFLLIGTACRLNAVKGLKCFLQSIPFVIRTNTRIRFIIWGDGPEKKILKSIALSLGIEKYLIFPGFRADIQCCLKALDIFVMSSFVENFSIGLLEAMRAGLPIIATNVGGNPEAIEHNKQGILIPPANPVALSQAILMLAENEEKRTMFGEEAKKRYYNEFTSDRMACETAKWFLFCAKKYSGA